MRNPQGDAVRTDPDRVFYTGDAISTLSMESNTAVILRLYTENDGPPQLIFPDWRLNDGDNSSKPSAL